jgi:hypothetical protein
MPLLFVNVIFRPVLRAFWKFEKCHPGLSGEILAQTLFHRRQQSDRSRNTRFPKKGQAPQHGLITMRGIFNWKYGLRAHLKFEHSRLRT